MDISVVIPTYQRPSEVLKAIESVYSQKFLPKEIIVVSDGSRDLNDKQVQEFQQRKELNFRYFEFPENKGVSAARNHGIQKAKFAWIGFLDSDDSWLPKKLLEQKTSLEKSGLFFSHTHEKWYKNGQFKNQKKKHTKYGGSIFMKCLPLCLISPSASLIHKCIFKDVGLFREDFPVCEDYELWLRITSKYKVDFCSTPFIIKNGGHPDQLSEKYLAMDVYRLQALKLQINNPNLSAQEHSELLGEIAKKEAILEKGFQKHGREKKELILKAHLK